MLYGDTSLISRDVYSRQSQENVEEFSKRLQIEGLTDRANSFLRGLLHHNEAKRMTVQQALQHHWFRLPRREAIAIEDAFKRINKYWKPREDFDSVIEDLPNWQALQERSSTPRPKRSRVPTVDPFPFIGLDSRLNPRVQLTSKETLLQDLKKKGSLFVNESAEKTVKPPRSRIPRMQVPRIASVLGSDLFGSKSLSPLPEEDGQQVSDEEISSVSASMAEYSFQGGSQIANKDSKSSMYTSSFREEQVEREPRTVTRSPHFQPHVRGDGFEPEELTRIPKKVKTYGTATKGLKMRKAA